MEDKRMIVRTINLTPEAGAQASAQGGALVTADGEAGHLIVALKGSERPQACANEMEAARYLIEHNAQQGVTIQIENAPQFEATILKAYLRDIRMVGRSS